MNTKYIYGIIETSETLELCTDEDPSGQGAHTIPYRDISALASDSEVFDYTALPKDKMAKYLLRHQRVIEKVMDSYPVIPMRLGTFACHPDEVRDILSAGYSRFKDVFKKINDKIEMDVAAVWADIGSVISGIGETKEIRELRETLASKPGGASVEDRVSAGKAVRQALDARRDGLALRICSALGAKSAANTAHDIMDEVMICNVAFLVEKMKKADFEKQLEGLDGLFGGEVNFRCVGPLPPYSFYTAEVTKFKPEDLARARKILGLEGGPLTVEEIEKSYRRMAMRCHPDRSGAEGEFEAVNRAYRLLMDSSLFGYDGPEDRPENQIDERRDLLGVRING